jgi:oxygen-independent coproporphyrinogen III oxidase
MVIELITRAIRRIAVGKEQDFVFKKREAILLPRLRKIDLYLHIPFCKTLCPYCPYNRIKYDENLIGPYTIAVLNEIDQYYSRLGKIAYLQLIVLSKE